MTRREWDTRIVWNIKHARWWWNAWREATHTEVWGFADSREDAVRAMTAAIRQAENRIAPVQPLQF